MKAGISKNIVLYHARYAFATYAMAETKNPALVRDVMGHADLRTTMIYQHPDLEPPAGCDQSSNSGLRRNTVMTQFTTHTKVLAASVAAKCMKRRNLLEPTIGLEPMTCRLRIDCSTS